MKKVVAGWMVVACASSHAFGGVISFDPVKIEINSSESTIGKFNVSVASMTEFGNVFNSFDVVFGSDDVDITGFVFDGGLAAVFGINGVDVPADPSSAWAHDADIGGFSFTGGTSPVFALGSLTFDVGALPNGTYTIEVDPAIDGNRSKLKNSNFPAELELLTGTATINIIPEPATISLLGLAALALVRRRKSV